MAVAAVIVGVWAALPAHVGAQSKGADAYQRGDFATALQQLRGAAEHGDAVAQYLLGKMYASGQGTPENLPEAVKWLRLSANQGNADAEALLGFLYAAGCGVAQDFAQSYAWSRKAADQGNGDGETNLGSLYANGNGVARDYNQALAWFQKAAQQHTPLAEMNLGKLYENGLAAKQDNAEAYRWYLLAAAHFGPPDLKNQALAASKAVAARLSPQQIDQTNRQVAQELGQGTTPAAAPATTIDAAKLDDGTLKDVAARFVKASAKMAPGIWAAVQACYEQAASAANKPLETKKCILLDYSGKLLDDGIAKQLHSINQDWYMQNTFVQRIAVHSPDAFGNPSAAPAFVQNNLGPYMEFVNEAMKAGPR